MAQTLTSLDSMAWRLPTAEREHYFALRHQYEAAKLPPADIVMALEGFIWSVFESQDD